MESERYRLQLQEAQRRLSCLLEHLDSVLKCNCKLGIGMDYVISIINELQSLGDWTAEKKEDKADSHVLFQKLQQLERIQKDLEKTAVESEQIRLIAEKKRNSVSSPIKEKHPSELNICDKNIDKNQIILLDNSLRESDDLSSSNSKTAQMLEDENVLLIDLNTPEETDISSATPVPNGIDSTSPEPADIAFDTSVPMVIDLNNSEAKDIIAGASVPKVIRSKSTDPQDSFGPNVSEDEGLGEESRKGDSAGPSSFIEIHSLYPQATTFNSVPMLIDNQIVITCSEGHIERKDAKNSLDLCLCAIGQLRKSLKSKENELLKLSALKNDQKQIAALQEVIVNLHKESSSLKSELENVKSENASLKEQLLELEEAENDARLQAQNFNEKLVFLQEKDSHFQSKLSETKEALEKCVEQLYVKEAEEQELHSQLKYMETLVQKYEEQIKTMEVVELALRKRLIEEDKEMKAIEKSMSLGETEKIEKGTQMYEPLSSKVNEHNDKVPTSLKCISDNKSSLDDTIKNTKLKEALSISIQVPDESIYKSWFVDCHIQTENLNASPEIDTKTTEQSLNSSTSKTFGEFSEESNLSTLSEIPSPIQKELLKRLHQLVEEDANLQQQLHYVDQINLTLWKKLHSLESHIGECKRKNISEDVASDSCFESEYDFLSRPESRVQLREDGTSDSSKCVSPSSSKRILTSLNQNEQEIKERLLKLEQINASFEKELEIREKLYLEKERKYGEWVQTEQRFIGDLKRLSDERDSIRLQVKKLEKEKTDLVSSVQRLKEEMKNAKQKHVLEIKNIKKEQEAKIVQLQQKVDQLLAKEKEHLKQITNLKLEQNNDKTESDKLKSSYVELQLELSRTRDDMRKKEEDFRIRIDELRSKHMLEEAKLISELEMMSNKHLNCDDMIKSFLEREKELIVIVKEKERALEMARVEYQKNVEATEEEHRAVEAELKKQLRQMEEGTSIATKALTEERVRLERELQENIDDLRGKEEGYKARIEELESNVLHLHDELHRITGDIDADNGNSGISSFKREKLMNQLKELRIRETELREKLDEMEQKEAAYRETLEHADRIVASVEQGYKNKIEELEISERNLKLRVINLEEIESRLRGALHKERRSSDGRKPDDLVVELLEAESRENTLKEKIENLEIMQRNATNKIKELEKQREEMEAQLSDKEDLAKTLRRTQQELESSKKSLAKLKKTENDLKASLQQTENYLNVTEAQMKSRIRSVEEEKYQMEETIRELRAQVRELKMKMEKMSDEREAKRLSMNVTKPSARHSYLSQTHDDEEPVYVDIDDLPSQSPVSQSGYLRNRPSSYIYNRSQTTSSLDAYGNKDSKRNSHPEKEIRVAQNSTDTYDSACQNLEDCMLRAMTAMKNDIKKKQSERGKKENHMKALLSTSNKVPSEQLHNEENNYDELLPRPSNFRVIQQVGSDTLLLGWDYVNPSILAGFEVYLNGQLLETVQTPDRTKALISGLDLKRSVHFSICAFSKYGQMSEPTEFEITPSNEGENSEENYEDSVYEKNRPYSMEW